MLSWVVVMGPGWDCDRIGVGLMFGGDSGLDCVWFAFAAWFVLGLRFGFGSRLGGFGVGLRLGWGVGFGVGWGGVGWLAAGLCHGLGVG